MDWLKWPNKVFIREFIVEMASIIIPDSEGSIPLCKFYSGSDNKTTSVIAFNLMMGKDKYIGYNYVAKLGNVERLNYSYDA